MGTLAIAATASASTTPPRLTLQNVACPQKPVNLSWTGNGFVASYRDNAARLVNITTDGKVSSFAPTFEGNAEVYVAVSNGEAGFPSGDLYLCSGDSIYLMDSLGSNAVRLATPTPGSTAEYLASDEDGAWGHLLYALTADGGLWSANSTGGVKLIASLGDNLTPKGIVVAPPSFGGHSGYMLVTEENTHQAVAISRTTPPHSLS